jgi:ATP-dependent exoDNAse (exonuclease V) beta subunit
MLIKIFDLGRFKGELVYLHTFQNLVLEFYTQERNDIRSFLDWWEDNKEKKSIQVSGDVDAMQIYTIHKSKGLQFKYVFIPFCSWDIDHKSMMAPTLWTHYEIDDKSIVVPVKYASKLEDTVFAEAYREERTRSYLDNLNLLYVAFTRAEKALIIFAPEPKGAKEKTVAALLLKALSVDDTLSKYWNEGSLLWIEGTLEKSDESITPKDDHILSLESYEVSAWRQRLSLRLSSDSPFKTDKFIDEASRKKGVLMHTLFAQIKYKAEAEQVFSRALQRGVINKDEQTTISNQFYRLLENQQIAAWFEEGWEVKTEAPILIPNSRDVRIDRIMIKDDQAIVIDYKTGEPREEDQEQVHTYMRILFSMNFIKVEGFVLYLNTGEVTPVKAETSKKGQNQLGLGI